MGYYEGGKVCGEEGRASLGRFKGMSEGRGVLARICQDMVCVVQPG